MCGIYGYVGKPFNKEKLCMLMKNLAIATEVRGTDSTGVVATTRRKAYFSKAVEKASKFVQHGDFEKAIVTRGCRYFLGHNRAASCGGVTVPNAHPFKGEKFFLVHNGTSRVANQMCDERGLVREGQTDSEAILKLIEADGLKSSEDLLNKLTDFSIVLLDYKKRNGALYFFRNHMKPMYVADLRKWFGVRIFASTKEILERAILRTFNLKVEQVQEILSTGWNTRPGCIYRVTAKDGEFQNIGKFLWEETEAHLRQRLAAQQERDEERQQRRSDRAVMKETKRILTRDSQGALPYRTEQKPSGIEVGTVKTTDSKIDAWRKWEKEHLGNWMEDDLYIHRVASRDYMRSMKKRGKLH